MVNLNDIGIEDESIDTPNIYSEVAFQEQKHQCNSSQSKWDEEEEVNI